MATAKRKAERGPEHKHFKIIEVREKADDKVECLYCERSFVAGATRMRAHLLKHTGLGCASCTGEVPDAVQKEMQQAEDASQKAKQQKKKEAAMDAATRSVTATASTSRSHQPKIQEAFKRADKSVVDVALAQWVYASGISFNALDSTYFKEFCQLVGGRAWQGGGRAC